MKNALPAALVGLTALITAGLIHAGYALWWLSQSLFGSTAASYDWAWALAVSGTATTIVLIAALVVRHLAAGNDAPAKTRPSPEAVSARVTSRRSEA